MYCMWYNQIARFRAEQKSLTFIINITEKISSGSCIKTKDFQNDLREMCSCYLDAIIIVTATISDANDIP
jgi:hypothetical protein